MTEHSPLPWRCEHVPNGTSTIWARPIPGSQKEQLVCTILDPYAKETSSLIVSAVNSHERLVEACKLALRQISDLDSVLNQPNHHVIGWHLNGDHEPVARFFADNDYGALDALTQALAQAEPKP